MLIIFDLDDTLYERSRFLPDNFTSEDLQRAALFPGAADFLSSFEGKLVLVTKETRAGLQERKIDILGIRKYFDLIMICYSDEEKGRCFREIAERFPDEEIWVVGNRVDSEIYYGKKLGLKTVWLKKGKYKSLKMKSLKMKEGGEKPDYEINEFKELSGVIKGKGCKRQRM